MRVSCEEGGEVAEGLEVGWGHGGLGYDRTGSVTTTRQGVVHLAGVPTCLSHKSRSGGIVDKGHDADASRRVSSPLGYR